MAQISKSCPNCGSTISFDEREMHATCGSCDVSFKVSELMNPGASAGENAMAEMAAMFASFESPESGLIYLESLFANMDWDDYAKSPKVIIAKAEQMIEKNNIKAGAVATTWYLDFVSVATPLAKKFEGLKKTATMMGEKYNPKDNTTILGDFDTYKAVMKALIANKDALIKRLESDVAFATKLNLDGAKLAEMNDKLAAIKKAYAAIPAEAADVEDIEFKAIPEVAAELAKADEKLAAVYSKKGIDAKQAYNEAVQYFNGTNLNKNGALFLFESIRDYKDSADYIEKINKYFNFNGEYFNFLGRSFIFKTAQPVVGEEGAEGVNPKAKDKKSAKKGCGAKKPAADGAEDEEYMGETLELYEVIDKLPSEKPVIEKITKIITVYANKLFYIKNANIVACYDFGALNETEICNAKKEGVKLDSRFYNNTMSKMYLSKDVKEAKLGCFASYIAKIKAFFAKLFKKQQKAPKVKNTLALMEINFANNACTDVIDAATKINKIQGDYIFYSVAEDFDENDLFEKNSLRSYNTLTGEKKLVLEDTHEIHDVVEGKVVYTINTPNVWNMQLRVHDIEKEDDVVIEDNIYEFKGVFGGKIFYTVGNARFQPLYSNSFKGDDRHEVMPKIENIIGVVNNWIYVEKYSTFYGKNVIIKVSLDGKERITLCDEYKSSVKITDNYFYYIDTNNNLCVVQGNGNGYCMIAENINEDNIIIDNKRNKIYYLRYETVGYGRAKNYSLYAMDIEGHGVKKVIFNISAMQDFDKDTLYIKKNEKVAFIVEMPGKPKAKKKGEAEGPEIMVLDLTRFYKFNKATFESELMLTLGMPTVKGTVKTGCGKTAEENAKFIELPRVPDHIANPVFLADEEDGADAASAAKNQEAEAAKGANGCNVGGQNINVPVNANGCSQAGSGCAKK